MQKNAYTSTTLSQTIGTAVAVLVLALTLLLGPSIESFANNGSNGGSGDPTTELSGWMASNGSNGGSGDPTGG